MVRWIGKHYHLSFTINEMVAELHFSPSYLSKLFKEQMGMTIIEYTNNKRLEEARTLLGLPSLTIEDVSKQTGFNYPSYFIAMFKKVRFDASSVSNADENMIFSSKECGMGIGL